MEIKLSKYTKGVAMVSTSQENNIICSKLGYFVFLYIPNDGNLNMYLFIYLIFRFLYS